MGTWTAGSTRPINSYNHTTVLINQYLETVRSRWTLHWQLVLVSFPNAWHCSQTYHAGFLMGQDYSLKGWQLVYLHWQRFLKLMAFDNLPYWLCKNGIIGWSTSTSVQHLNLSIFPPTCGMLPIPLQPVLQQGMALVLKGVGILNSNLVNLLLSEIQFSC